MSKGILGLGCSYTWGEGLYFYSDLDNLPFSENHMFDFNKVTPAMMLYKNKHRFIDLISNHYNTWCWVEPGNGGTNIQFCDYIETNFKNRDKFNYNDFSLLVFQFTQVSRDLKNDIDVYTQIETVDSICKKFEKNGIKVVSFCWDEEIPNNFLYNRLFKNRHIDITINGITKPAFDYFIWNDEYNITIASDFKTKNLQKNDLHFNKKGHRLIADLIIKKLEQDKFTL